MDGPQAAAPSPQRTDFVQVTALAARFRHAIEQSDQRRLPPGFDGFPAGCCGDAALFLGTFFKEQGFGTFTYVCGLRGEGADQHSHAWFEAPDGVIIDITADQFPEITEPVIVTAHSDWHNTFDQEERHEADYRIYDEGTVARLGIVYQTILREFDG
jgi:hypothetical protein